MKRNINNYGIPYSQRGRYSNFSSADNAGTNTNYTISATSGDSSKGSVTVIKVVSINTSQREPAEEQVSLRGAASYPSGTQFRVTAHPAAGYQFKSWSGDAPAGKSGNNPLVITLTKNVSLVANFERVAEQVYTVNVNWDRAKGNVTGSGLTNGSATVHRGDSITLKASANSGFKFVRWEGVQIAGNVQSNNSETITLTVARDMNLKAVFAEVNSGSGSGGSGSGSGDSDNFGSDNGSGENLGIHVAPGTGDGGSSSPMSDNTIDQAKGFVKKWWWAILIVGYVVYKNWKGGKL